MKRMFSFFLALALLAVLSGCGKREPTPSRPDEPTPPPEEGITLAELNVEFVAGDRDTDALMQLKKELPPLLIGALADEGVTVGRVNVTFGASDEATADALARGSVQVGFMPMETYLAHGDTLRLVSVPEEPAGDTERVGLYFPVSDQNRTLRAAFEKDAAGGGALHAWETLLGSFWMDNGSDPVFAVPVDDDVARRFLDSMMDVNANGMTADSIPRLTEYVSADEVFSTADLVVLHGEAPDEALWMEIYGCTVGGETVSVSTADAIVGGDEFAAALLAALEKLSADETAQTVLRLYDGDGVRYGGADTQAVEFAQYLLGNTEGVYQLTSEEKRNARRRRAFLSLCTGSDHHLYPVVLNADLDFRHTRGVFAVERPGNAAVALRRDVADMAEDERVARFVFLVNDGADGALELQRCFRHGHKHQLKLPVA